MGEKEHMRPFSFPLHARSLVPSFVIVTPHAPSLPRPQVVDAHHGNKYFFW